MPKFEVVSEYQPSGDQPEAIAALAEGIENGLKEQVLLGVTGSGKTFTMAKVIQKRFLLRFRLLRIRQNTQSSPLEVITQHLPP